MSEELQINITISNPICTELTQISLGVYMNAFQSNRAISAIINRLLDSM